MFKSLKLASPRDWLRLRIFDESQDRAINQLHAAYVTLLLLFAAVSAIVMLSAGYFLLTGNPAAADRAFVAAVASEMVISLVSFVARCPGIGLNHLVRAALFAAVALL